MIDMLIQVPRPKVAEVFDLIARSFASLNAGEMAGRTFFWVNSPEEKMLVFDAILMAAQGPLIENSVHPQYSSAWADEEKERVHFMTPSGVEIDVCKCTAPEGAVGDDEFQILIEFNRDSTSLSREIAIRVLPHVDEATQNGLIGLFYHDVF